MSLKAFHVFFIAVSILLAAGFGVWGLREHAAGRDGLYLALGVLSLVIAACLVVYLVLFLKKVRGATFLAAAGALALSGAERAAACPVCWGDSDSPMARAANLGIFVLLGVTAVVLGWFVAVILAIRHRARRHEEVRSALRVVSGGRIAAQEPGGR